MREQDVEQQGTGSAPGAMTPAGPAATTRGDQLKTAASHVGDHAAQEEALKPGAALLAPPQVDEAVGYNARRAKAQGPAWVKALQEFVGAPPSGAYDAATVGGVAEFQDGRSGLTVDGKVGPKTEGALSAEVRAKPVPEGAPPTDAAGASAAPPTTAQAGTPDAAATVAKAPDGPEVQARKDALETPRADVEPVPVDVKALVAKLDGALMPLSLRDAGKLDLGTLPSWIAERAATLGEAASALEGLAPLSADRATLEQALASAAAFAASIVDADGAAIRDHAIKLVNEASVLKDPAQQPVLPTQADTRAYQAALKALGDVGARTALAASGVAAAVPVAQDGALAIFQGLSVLSARATWKKGVVEPGADGVAAANKDPDNALKGIFQDAGWGSISTTKVKKDDGTEYEKVVDWCGMFVGSALYRGGGLDEELRAGFLHTSNVLDYFQYQQVANADRAPKSIWADGAWHDLKTYHGERGSQRRWTTRAAVTSAMEADAPLDIRPGDVVLIDHSGTKTSPQHITMVESYDPATKILATIEGNTGGIQAPDKKVKGADGTEHWRTHRGADGSGVHTRDMTNMSATSRKTHAEQHAANKADAAGRPAGSYGGTKGSTVFGIGRPSVVDFEEHRYAKLAVPENLKTKSPEEMMALAKQGTKEGAQAKKAGVKAAQ